ncbi:MAG: hypothetical protein ACOC22_03280 [bacterium]
MVSQIHQLYGKLSNELGQDPRKKRQLTTLITSTVSGISSKAMASDESYCFRFNLPLNLQKKIFEIIESFDQNDLYNAFTKDWGNKAMLNRMHSDPYYQILLVLFYYGIKENDRLLKENCLMLVLFKIWNGRKTKFIKWCNKDIMEYVISYMTSKRHIVNKYDDPYDLIKNYFIPTLLKKYEPMINRDSIHLKTIFEQGYVRIRQIFVQDNFTNIKTGKRESRGGLFPLYKKAHDEGLSMANPSVRRGPEMDTPGYEQYATGSLREELSNKVVDYITLNPKPQYSQNFIRSVRREIPVSVKLIEQILIKMHDHSYYNTLHEIVNIILSQTQISNKNDVCSPDFINKVKKNVIASKNNKTAKARIELTMKILDDIFSSMNLDIKNYSVVNQIQIRKVLTYGIVHNIQRSLCYDI